MDISGIAAASMTLSAAKVSQSVGVAVLKKTMNAQKDNAQQLLSILAPAPKSAQGPGQYIDISI